MEDTFVDSSFLSTQYIICECGETFSSDESLNEHLEKEQLHSKKKEIKEYQCGLCTRVFSTARACTNHYQRLHATKVYLSRSKQTPDSTEKKKYGLEIVCEVCGKKYASHAALRYHQRVHTGERPFKCPMCPKTFTMPLFLQVHIRTHTGEKPYQCSVCPKAFTNKAALLRHDRVHTGVKPYVCEECGKSFTQSNSRKLHINTVHLKMPAPYKSHARKNKVKKNVKIYIDTKTNIAYEIDNKKTKLKNLKDTILLKVKSPTKEPLYELDEIDYRDKNEDQLNNKATIANNKVMIANNRVTMANNKVKIANNKVTIPEDFVAEPKLEIVDEEFVYQEVVYNDDEYRDEMEVYEIEETVDEDVTYVEEVIVKPEILYQEYM